MERSFPGKKPFPGRRSESQSACNQTKRQQFPWQWPCLLNRARHLRRECPKIESLLDCVLRQRVLTAQPLRSIEVRGLELLALPSEYLKAQARMSPRAIAQRPQ